MTSESTLSIVLRSRSVAQREDAEALSLARKRRQRQAIAVGRRQELLRLAPRRDEGSGSAVDVQDDAERLAMRFPILVASMSKVNDQT